MDDAEKRKQQDDAIWASLIVEARLKGITPQQLLEELTDGLDEEDPQNN